MDKFLIVDGHCLLFQMFYGMPSRIINKNGIAIQGTMGFIGALLKMIKSIKPTHIVVLFDSEQQNLRTEINDEYKANRIDYSEVAPEDSPFTQLEDIYKALDYLNIMHCEVEKYECDDAISSYVKSYKDTLEIVIASWDSDFFQLIEENVKVYRYRGINSILCDEKYIELKFDIEANQYVDYKILVGDKSDNIEGVKNIGKITAVKLLNEYKSITNIINSLDYLPKTRIYNILRENINKIKENIKLIKLDNRCPLPFPIEQLKYQYMNQTTTDVLTNIGLK